MTPYRMNVIQLSEIVEASVVCPTCTTQMTIRLDRLDHAVPRNCPTCLQAFDEVLNKTLTNLRESCLLSGRTKFRVEFHIKDSEKQ